MPNRMHAKIAGFAGCLLLCWAVGAIAADEFELWRNVAGHELEARAIELDGNMLLLERKQGSQLRISLDSLMPEDAARARELFGRFSPPDAFRQDYLRIERRLERMQAFRQAGRVGDEEFNDAVMELELDFDRSWVRVGGAISDSAYAKTRDRLFSTANRMD